MNTYTLKDLVTIKNGKDHKHLADGKFPVYGSGGIMRYAESYLYDKPSILLPRKGTLDNIQFCEVPFWTVDTSYYTEVNETLCNPYYLYCYLNLLDLSKLNTGTGVPSMTFDSYYNIKIHLPSKSIQDKIASFLSTLDRKISLNRSINAELERMAKEIYDYWFVQFEFPRSVSGESGLPELSRTDDGNGQSQFPDANGRPYKSSGGAMVYNPVLKREVPAGWEVKTLSSVCDIFNGATPSTKDESNYGGDIIWITPKDLSDQKSKFTFHGERNITQKGFSSCSTHMLPKGTILMSSRAPIGLVSIASNELCTNQGFKNLVPKEIIDNAYLYYYIKMHIKQIEQLGTGTTFKEVSREDLVKFPILYISNRDLYKKWYSFVKPIFDKQAMLCQEIEELTSLRDELLPLLMTRQVEV